MLVFDDCEINKTVSGVTFGCFIASGQTCIAGTRLLIQKSISEVFLNKLKEKMFDLRMGDPFSTDTSIGPVISKDSLFNIDKKVESVCPYCGVGCQIEYKDEFDGIELTLAPE